LAPTEIFVPAQRWNPAQLAPGHQLAPMQGFENYPQGADADHFQRFFANFKRGHCRFFLKNSVEIPIFKI
jgi:hypothetical protein